MTAIQKYGSLVAITLLVLLIVVTWITGREPQLAVGSVSVSSEYNATTTGQINPASKVTNLKNGSGTLGSVVVTVAGAAGGHLEFYDATTTDASLRAAQYSTSTILKVSVPNNAAAGTYTFDAVFAHGIQMVYTGTAGSQATTSITWR